MFFFLVFLPVFGKPFFEAELCRLLATHQNTRSQKAPGALTTEFVDIFMLAGLMIWINLDVLKDIGITKDWVPNIYTPKMDDWRIQMPF